MLKTCTARASGPVRVMLATPFASASTGIQSKGWTCVGQHPVLSLALTSEYSQPCTSQKLRAVSDIAGPPIWPARTIAIRRPKTA